MGKHTIYNQCKHTISSSDGISLHFQDEASYQRYQSRLELLNIETYATIRRDYGIYCSNQNKFVDTREEMRGWDCKYMEDLYDKYYPYGNK